LSYQLGATDSVKQTLSRLRDHHSKRAAVFKIVAVPGDVMAFVGEALNGTQDDLCVATYRAGQVAHFRVPAGWFSDVEPIIEAHVLVGPEHARLFCVCPPDSDPEPIARAAATEAQALI
jgi:hypothetical protein